jgi:LUD domain
VTAAGRRGPRLRWRSLPGNLIDRRGAALALPILLAVGLNVAAVAGLAGIAGFHAVYASLIRIQWPWPCAVPAALAMSAIGYYFAYRRIYAAEGGYQLMFALGFATQAQQMKAIGGQPDYALGSVHAVTRDGTLVTASASGSQLASYAWGAANVILVAGAQKLVPTLAAAHERIYQHSLPLEDARAQAAYGQHSQVAKILEIHTELPGRIHVVLIGQQVGF